MKLNSQQIHILLKRDIYSKKIFRKVLARDELPSRVSYPSAYVINTDKRSKPGRHWLAIFYDKNGNCEFFDSFGMDPCFYGLESFLKRTSNKWKYSNIQIQQNFSNYCGYYCVYFIWLRCRGISLESVQSLFSQNKKNNDSLIKNILF